MKLRIACLSALLVCGIAAVSFARGTAPPRDGSMRPPQPPASGAAAAEIAGLKPLASVEGITEYDLPNGLRVLLFPDPSKETATVNVTYLVGSRCEDYGETGMAHLLEHLMFKGTPRHRNIPGELTVHGCRPNGSTWLDRTNYYETFAASDTNLNWALDLEADRMVNSFIARKDLDSEMTVVRNEYEQGENNPQGVLEERVLSSAYLWHNYGKSTIGARSDIEMVPIERLQAFYRKWYQPDNAVLVVAGKIDPAKTLPLVVKYFGAIPLPARPLPTTYTIEPAQDGERAVTLRRVGDTQAVVAAYHIPAGSHPDFAPIEMLGNMLGDTPSGRLYKALVETKMATSVGAWPYQPKDPGVLIARCEVPSGKPVEAARDTLLRVVESSGASLPSKEEFDRAKERLLKEWEMEMRNSERAAIGLSEWAAMGDWRLLFIHRDRLQAVTPEDVRRVAAAYLRQTNRTAGMFLPTKAAERVEIPATPDVATLVKDYKGGRGLAEGAEFAASPESIEAKITRIQLANGMKVILLPKKTRGGAVQVSVGLHFGDEKSLYNQATVGGLTGSMLMRGTKAHSRQQIADEIDHLKARIRVFGGATGVNGGIEATRETLPGALSLLAEILRQPSFPDSEFQMLKQEEIAQLKDAKTEPRELARLTLQRHMNPYPVDDVRYVMMPDEEIAATEKVTIDQVRSFHDDFYGAGGGQVAVIGDFDPKEIGAVLDRLLGDWKSVKPYTRIASPYHEVAAINQSIETPDKESAVMSGSLPIDMRDDDPDYPALTLGSYMTGGGFLNSRLATRIRQKEGLSYGVGGFFFASPFDKNAFFMSFAIYAPQNDDRLVNAFREEMTGVYEKGFTAQEIVDAKTGWLQQRRVSRSSDRELGQSLTSLAEAGRTLAWSADVEKRVTALTVDDVNAAIHRRFDPAKITIVRAGDFEKAKKAGGAGGAMPEAGQAPSGK